MEDMQWLIEMIEKENKKLHPVLGEIPAGKAEIRAYLLERYLDAIKSTPGFNHEVLREINESITFRMYRGRVHPGEDSERIKRELEVAAALDRAIRDGVLENRSQE